jgi:hypothetical protein
MNETLSPNLEYIRRSSRRAALVTLVSGLVLVTSLVFSWSQIRSLDQKLEIKRSEIGELDKVITQKQSKIKELNNELRLISKTTAPETTKTLPARVYIHIADEKQRKMAEAAAAQLRATGYIVPGIEYVGHVGPTPTQVRYFRRNDEQGTALKGILTALQERGIEASPQYISGYSTIGLGHFELWFGTNATRAVENPWIDRFGLSSLRCTRFTPADKPA